MLICCFFFFQAEDGIRYLVRSRGLGDVYKRQRDYRDGWDLIRTVDHPNIGIVLDSFHVFALDLPVEPIADIDPAKVFLVEVADLPKVQLDFVELSRAFRLFPGEGATPIDSFLAQVDLSLIHISEPTRPY